MRISNFRAVKRTDQVVRVFAGVNARRPARLLMVGEGPERPQAAALAHELGVADRVVFLGSFPRVETLLCIADLFLLPSAKESFGLTARERARTQFDDARMVDAYMAHYRVALERVRAREGASTVA